MALSKANRQKHDQLVDQITIVTISGSNVRPQNADPSRKWPKKLVNFWDRHVFVTKTTPKSELKMDVSAANGQKSWSIFGP